MRSLFLFKLRTNHLHLYKRPLRKLIFFRQTADHLKYHKPFVKNNLTEYKLF